MYLFSRQPTACRCERGVSECLNDDKSRRFRHKLLFEAEYDIAAVVFLGDPDEPVVATDAQRASKVRCFPKHPFLQPDLDLGYLVHADTIDEVPNPAQIQQIV